MGGRPGASRHGSVPAHHRCAPLPKQSHHGLVARSDFAFSRAHCILPTGLLRGTFCLVQFVKNERKAVSALRRARKFAPSAAARNAKSQSPALWIALIYPLRTDTKTSTSAKFRPTLHSWMNAFLQTLCTFINR